MLEPHKCSYSQRLLLDLNAYKVAIHEGCICNEYLSLTRRHLVHKDVKLDIIKWKELSSKTAKLFYNDKLVPLTYREVISRIRPSKKKIYIAALNKISTFGLWKRATLKMFIKPDRYPYDTILDKPPRAIQYRSPEFNLCFMKYVKPIEDWAYESLCYGVCSRTRVIMKGLNPIKRGQLLQQKLEHFQNPKFYLIDHSAFDSTITEHHLRSTHNKYFRLMGKGQFRWCCHQQINNKGHSRHGITYRVRGTRMSGDADTALGNCIVNADAIYGVLEKSGVTKYDFFLDGDDAVIIVEKEDALDIDYFSVLGFLTKCEIVEKVSKIDFCQSRPVYVNGVLQFVRNPIRAMSHYCLTRLRLPLNRYKDLLAGIALCENSLHNGVPIYSAFSRGFSGRKPMITDEIRQRMEGLEFNMKFTRPSLDTRMSFYDAWDIPISDQILMEEEITAASENSKFDVKSLQSTRARWELRSESSGSGWWKRC